MDTESPGQKPKEAIKRTKQELMACRALRLAWDRSFLKWDALRKVKVEANQYRCEKCQKVFKLREVQVDHKTPCVLVTGWDGMANFAQRLFCPSDQLQVLCQDNCHPTKSKKENLQRRERQKARKCRG